MNTTQEKLEEEVKEHILTSYINGAYNKRNLDNMRKGFHKDFAIFSADGEDLGKYPLDDWISNMQNSINEGYDPDDPKNKWEHEFSLVDVTGNSAIAQLQLYNEGTHIYTDYISLLKFDSGWKIVAKIYYQHNERINW